MLVAIAAVVLGLGLLLPAAVVVSAAACDTPPVSQLAVNGIPADYLALYQQAGTASGISWNVLAAIGWTESRHGTLDAAGVRSGMNAAGAAGPMQFGIGGRAGNTWGGEPVRAVPPILAYGMDGNNDGVANVYDPGDAIPAAAGYLIANGAQQDLRAALYAYNRADWYVAQILEQARAYSSAELTTTPVGLPASGCVDPLGDFDSDGSPSGAWGGYRNGRIPLDQFCTIGGGQLLRCDAAAAFAAMNAAHIADLGRPIVVTDSYRDYAAQIDVYTRKPDWAATPGTSNHGWGLAADLTVGGWTGQTFRWLQTNAARYGWRHPPWAQIDGSRPEAWHWEFGGP